MSRATQAFIPEAKLQFSKFGHVQKANFESEFLALKGSLPPRLLPLAFSPPHFFCFSPIFCVGHLLRFLSVGKGFAKSPRIVKFLGRKYEWVVGQDFQWNFLVKVTWFLWFFLACLTKSCSLGYGLKDLLSLHKFVV